MFATLNFGVVLGMSVCSGEEEYYSRIRKHCLGHWTKEKMQTFLSIRKQLHKMVRDGEASWCRA